MVRYDRRKGAPQEETLSREPLTRLDLPVWREIPVMLAAKLYGSGRLSSERAAKLAGISHVEFFFCLGFYKVFPLQFELNELEQSHKQKKEQAEKAKKEKQAQQAQPVKQPAQKREPQMPKQDQKPVDQVKISSQEKTEAPPEPVQSEVQPEVVEKK